MKLWANFIKKVSRLLLLFFVSIFVQANANISEISLQSHRAIYQLSLGNSEVASGISGISGKLEFEFSGSVCEGYTTNINFLINIHYSQGDTGNFDITSSTYENLVNQNFQFAHKTLFGTKVIDNIHGFAERDNEKLDLEIILPEKEQVKISSDALFPTEHILKTIEQAQIGTRYFLVNTFDGTEDGKKIYETSTFIGTEGGSTQDIANSSSIEFQELAGMKFWPVTFAYFEQDEEQRSEQIPAIEVIADLYENGVHSTVQFKYPDYIMNGELMELEYFPNSEC